MVGCNVVTPTNGIEVRFFVSLTHNLEANFSSPKQGENLVRPRKSSSVVVINRKRIRVIGT